MLCGDSVCPQRFGGLSFTCLCRGARLSSSTHDQSELNWVMWCKKHTITLQQCLLCTVIQVKWAIMWESEERGCVRGRGGKTEKPQTVFISTSCKHRMCNLQLNNSRNSESHFTTQRWGYRPKTGSKSCVCVSHSSPIAEFILLQDARLPTSFQMSPQQGVSLWNTVEWGFTERGHD